MTSVRWSQRAFQQIQAISKEISIHSESAASRQVGRILEAIEQLTHFPSSGPVFSKKKAGRQLTVPGTKYLILYRHTQGVIEIAEIRHGAERPLKRFPR